MISYVKKGSEPTVLTFSETEKVFDRVQWDLLVSILDKMKFGSSFGKWVGMIYYCQEVEVHRGRGGGQNLSHLGYIGA